MLTVIAAFAVGMQDPAAGAANINPSQLISKMLAYYNDARTLVGSIVMTQKFGEQGGTITTQIQFEQPDKVYIRQQKSTGDRRVWQIVANGKAFAYDAPDLRTSEHSRRLVEAQVIEQKRPNGQVEELMRFSFRDVYGVGAPSLGDRSTPLDIAIGRNSDLRAIRDQWKTVAYRGTADYNGKTVHVVMGDWRPYGTADAEGQYRMYLTDAGELLQFARSETVNFEGSPKSILTTWDVKLEKNGSPDPRLFSKIQ